MTFVALGRLERQLASDKTSVQFSDSGLGGEDIGTLALTERSRAEQAKMAAAAIRSEAGGRERELRETRMTSKSHTR